MVRNLALAACLFFVLGPAAQAAPATLPMFVRVHPNPMNGNASHEYVEVVTQPRIICVAFVLLDNGTLPHSFPHAQTQVTSYRGIAVWHWADRPSTDGGTASVSCNNSITTRTVNVHFRVVRPAQRHATAPVHRQTAKPFFVLAAVSPNPIPATAYFATLTTTTTPGARCAAGIFYNDGAVAQSFAGFPQTANRGVATWHWHPVTTSGGGTATITCTFNGRTLAATALFSVSRS